MTDRWTEREAMWIRIKSSSLFAINVFIGGLNAVSGEYAIEIEQTIIIRMKSLAKSVSIQDYIVTPQQLWLDGVRVYQRHYSPVRCSAS